MKIMKRFLLGWMIAGMLCWGSMPVLAAAQPSASRAAQVQDGIAARRAYEHLAQRLDRHYRTMPVIGDIQYKHTKAAIRNNRAHQTPLSTSELLFARCMHDGNYAEASAIAVMAVFDAYEPAERAHFRLRQAETMIVRQIDLPGTQRLLEEAARELAAAEQHDEAWQQDMAAVEEYAGIVTAYGRYSPR